MSVWLHDVKKVVWKMFFSPDDNLFSSPGILHPKVWDVYPKLWYVHPKLWDVYPKLWDIKNMAQRKHFIREINHCLSRWLH